MRGNIEKHWFTKKEKISEGVFLTKQYIKLLQDLVYVKTKGMPISPVLRLLEDNVEARKKLNYYSHKPITKRIK